MPIPILMPALSPTMTEGNLAKWLKKEGDPVAPGDLIAEIETDKATMEVEAIEEGIMGRLMVAEGTEGVEVNAVIAYLLARRLFAEERLEEALAYASTAHALRPDFGRPIVLHINLLSRLRRFDELTAYFIAKRSLFARPDDDDACAAAAPCFRISGLFVPRRPAMACSIDCHCSSVAWSESCCCFRSWTSRRQDWSRSTGARVTSS